MSQEIPEHILLAAKDLCEYMPPNILAELVDYWSNELDYLELAQIAFDEGAKLCGAKTLAEYIPAHGMLEKWSRLGVNVK